MKHFTSTFSIVALTLWLTSCISISITSNFATGEVEERTFPLSEELTSLAISHGADVIIDPTIPQNEIRVRTHTDIFEILELEVNNGNLEIGLEHGSLSAKTFDVRIPKFDYNTFALSGGSSLEWDNCNVDRLAVAISGGADIEVEGKCSNLTVAASGGADASFEELLADEVSVSASGGADVEVHALKVLNVNASGGADVGYAGHPTVVDINTSGGADVYPNTL